MRKYLFFLVFGLGLNTLSGQNVADTVTGTRLKLDEMPDDSTASKQLDELVVARVKNHVRVTSRGIKVAMRGNPLAGIGTAVDAIRQMPLIDGATGEITVVGKGTPVVYINGRLMRDRSELDVLTSADLESVEIITNPSSKYGPEVTSVLLIKTKRRMPGVNGNLGMTVSASEKWSEYSNGGIGYRMDNGLTLFGDFSLSDSRFRQDRRYYDSFPRWLVESGKIMSPGSPASGASVEKPAADDVMYSITEGNASNHTFSFMADGGVNYDHKGHSFGLKYTFNRTPSMKFRSDMVTISNAWPGEPVRSVNSLREHSGRHYINGYAYVSLPKTTELRLDFDYIRKEGKSDNGAYEYASATSVTHRGETEIHLKSGKIELEKKWERANLLIGADYTYTRSIQDFMGQNNSDSSGSEEVSEVHVSATDNVKQNLYSTFISADWTINDKWMLTGGVRYDATRTRYVRNGVYEPGLSKHYDNLLPDIGVTFQSPVTVSLSYRQLVYRPSYSSLDNNYTYVTPTHWETGNPRLQQMKANVVGLSIYYKKFIFQGEATHYDRKIGMAGYYDPAVKASVSTTVNLPSYNMYQLVGVQRLDVGLWHPTLQGVLLLQDLRYGDPERKYNRPFYQLSLNNRFDLPEKIYAYLSVFVRGNGNVELQHCGATWQT